MTSKEMDFFYVFDIHFQKPFLVLNVKLYFGLSTQAAHAVSTDAVGYALISTNKFLSNSSDGPRHFNSIVSILNS